MNSLTPLRYGRHWRTGAVFYGDGEYYTDCGRFIVWQDYENQWHINGSSLVWYDWVGDIGLKDVDFRTRREAVDALHATLQADDLLHAIAP